jgi:alkylhydroperoxidase family enzyme
MARVTPLTDEQIEENPVIKEWGPLGRIYGYTPEVLEGLGTFYRPLRDGHSGRVQPLHLWELMRLRVGLDSGCILCQRGRRCDVEGVQLVPEEKVVQVADYENGDFDEREKMVLRFTDKLSNDHFSIDDAFFDDLHKHFDDEQIVELAFGITFAFGLAKMNNIFEIQ